MNNSHTKLKERLKELRKENKFTQEDVARKIGLTKSAYGYYEQGKTVPDALTLNRLADVFNVSTDYLLAREKEDELPVKITNAYQAMQFILKQPTVMAYGGYANLSENELIDFANDLLQQLKLISYKYNNK